MSQVKQHTPGTFCWADLATNDVAGAKRFYSELFGWKTQEQPSPNGEYTFLRLQNDDVAGLAPLSPDQKLNHALPHWLSFVTVQDVEASAKKAVAAGGKLVSPPRRVDEQGSMALIQDPTGAELGLWQPKRHLGAKRVGEPGAACWTELITKDTRKAASFYEELFGWTSSAPEGLMGYVQFFLGERSVGGMMAPAAGRNEVPTHWQVYFQVDQADRTIDRVKKMGGGVLVPAQDVPKVGRFAVVKDPQGASFAVLQPAP